MNNPLKVVVDEQQGNLDNVESRSGTSKGTGREWSMRSQFIWVYEQGAKFPMKVQFVLPESVPVYPAGNYYLDLNTAFTTGNFNSLNIDTRKLKLVPIQTK